MIKLLPRRRRLAARLVLLVTGLFLAGCASDSMEKRRVGQQMVCHDGSQTLAVSNADSFVHLDHGDAPGPCPGD